METDHTNMDSDELVPSLQVGDYVYMFNILRG